MRPRKAFNQINVVPYIDVMLVLLVIFMVTAPLITPGEITLPTIGQKPAVPTSPIHIYINKDRSLGVRDERAGSRPQRVANADAAVALIKERQEGRPDQAVVIEADKTVPYGDVLAVLDRLQAGGAQRVGLLVQPPQK